MGLGHEEIRAELERVLSATSFKRSERLSNFLRFIVNAGIEAKHDNLKEYVLGAEVYEKGQDFDPRVDSTVRVEAARLRSKLREYYETEGRSNPLRIELPKGGYAPLFHRHESLAVGGSRRPVLIWASGLTSIALASILIFGLQRDPTLPAMVKPLTTWPGEELEPAFSPDGMQVAMVWSGENNDNDDIYVKPIAEGPRVRLTTNPARDKHPAWSPDGRLIAFLRQSADGSAVYLVPAVGGTERLVAKVHTFDTVLDWLPDAQSLAVSDRNARDAPLSVFLLAVATGEKRQLTSAPSKSYGDFQARLSPDGRTLAFARSISFPASDIFIAPASGGGEPRRLTFENQVITGLSWSADGRSIVFSSERGATAGAGSLWRVQADGSGRPRLQQIPGAGPRASRPAVSRRGGLIAYQEMYQDTNLWRAPANGSGSPELLISSTREEVRPDYSPDGSRIAFNSNRSGHVEIWIANSDGSSAYQLTSFDGAPAWSPRWSRDGRLIAFCHVSEGNADIYTMTPEGSSIKRVTQEPSYEETPSWSKDGQWLYFSSNRSGRPEIWKMALNDSARVIQLTQHGGKMPLESPDGKYLYFQRDQVVLRVPVNGGAETRLYAQAEGISAWAPDLLGIYVAARNQSIAHYNLETGRMTPLVPSGNKFVRAEIRGLALSPDGGWLLYSRLDRAVSDIMLVENFK